MSKPTEEVPTFKTHDSLQAAAFKIFGHTVATERDDSTGRVFFLVHGDIEGTLARIFHDEPVGVRTFVEVIKELRRGLFNAKGGPRR